ncbi:MAG: hypothetical protein CM15mV119_180 [uncultured marine virus]|nr:MAG: hypothetical protein CM15mV119_180 [uncultured marine virus]
MLYPYNWIISTTLKLLELAQLLVIFQADQQHLEKQWTLGDGSGSTIIGTTILLRVVFHGKRCLAYLVMLQ